MKNITVLIGAGQIGLAIASRVSAEKHILLADLKKENAEAVAKVLSEAVFEVSTAVVDVSGQKDVETLAKMTIAIGEVTNVIHAAGVSLLRQLLLLL